MKKLSIWTGIGIVAVEVLAGLAVHFFLDIAIKKGVETIGPRLAKVDVRLDSAKLVHPFRDREDSWVGGWVTPRDFKPAPPSTSGSRAWPSNPAHFSDIHAKALSSSKVQIHFPNCKMM